MGSARIHTRNLLYNWGGHAANLLVMFFLSPFIVGKLEPVLYGIWSLLNVLTGYMGLFDIGVRASVGRHIALYLGKKDRRGVDETIRAGLGFYSLVSMLILFVGIIISIFFHDIFRNVPSEYHGMIRILLPLMVINIWLSAVSAIYASILAGHDRFDITRKVDFLVLVLRAAGTVWVLKMGMHLWGLASITIFVHMIGMIGNKIYAKQIYPLLRNWPPFFSKIRMKELVNYGFPSFISSVATKIIGQTDLIIAGAAISVAVVREYSIGSMVVLYSSTFLTLLGRTFFPAMQRAIGSGRAGEGRYICQRQMQLALCLFPLIYIGMAVYSKPFIHLWMFQDGFDDRSVGQSALVMTVLAIGQLPLLYTRPALDFLSALGHIGLSARLMIIEALLNLALSLFFVLVQDLGLMGIALGTLVSRFLVTAIWAPLYVKRKSEFSIRKFVGNILVPGSMATIAFYLICTLMLNLWNPLNWASFAGQIVFVSSIWAIIAFWKLLPGSDRRRISAYVKGCCK